MALHALQDLRDDVRRLLQIVPPIDDGTGGVGAQPTTQPDPNNAVVNSAINQGIAAMNRVVRVGPLSQVSIAVASAPVYTRGPHYVDVSSVLPTLLSASEVENVTWDDGASNRIRLEPFTYYAEMQNYQQFPQYAPGVPRQFIGTGNQIGLLPPPSASGTLYFSVASGLPALTLDADTTTGLPAEFQPPVVYWAVALLSARQATDVEAQARAIYFGNLAREGLIQAYAWRNGYSESGIQSVRDTLIMTPWNTLLERIQAGQTGPAIGPGPAQQQQQ